MSTVLHKAASENRRATVGFCVKLWLVRLLGGLCLSAWADGPVLPALPDVTVEEQTTMTVTNTASSSGVHTPGFTYVLLAPPPGATIDTNGVITWTPAEAQGPSTNTITTFVTDGASPPLSATNRFTVFVQEINSAPVLPKLPDFHLTGRQLLLVTNKATDVDLPVNTLTYQLLAAPPRSCHGC